MKQISVNRTTALIDIDNSRISPTELRELTDEVSRNRLAVLEGALSVENLLSKMIGHFFFKRNNGNDKRLMFDEMVLNSDWCSFAAKRKLLTQIINKENLLQGSKKEEFDKNLQRVISFRNAFAHGKFSSDGKVVWLNYFAGTPQKQELTEKYLEEVESKLQSAWDRCFELAEKMGAIKSIETVNPVSSLRTNS